MTLADIRDLLLTADPDIRHYFSTDDTRDYSYWEETRRLPIVTDDKHDEAWRFYVHRFTRDEFDQVAQRIFRVLDADPRTTVRHTVDSDTKSRYIHHIYECEGY